MVKVSMGYLSPFLLIYLDYTDNREKTQANIALFLCFFEGPELHQQEIHGKAQRVIQHGDDLLRDMQNMDP